MKRSDRFGSGMMALAALLAAWTTVASGQESPHGNIKVPCEKCHTATSWTAMRVPSGFDHGSTRFPLAGQHAALQCRSCHPTLKFSPTARECAGCHSDIHRGELGLLCERCHTPQSWLIPDMIQRHSQTRFPLHGAHRVATCGDCHLNQEKQEYVGVPSECYGCHRQDFEATLSPAHIPAGFGTDCAVCHRIEAISWSGSFNHSATAFPLTGAHQTVPCVRCHPGNNFKGAPTDCYQCHQQDYAGTRNPPHATSGYPTVCASCHSTAAWRPATFDHNQTRFPLTGEHRNVPCADCHKNGQYTGTPTSCSACHQGNFAATTNPPHLVSGIPTTCESCHSTTAWQPATFDHNRTAFPLTGAHLAIPCVQCHPGGNFTGASKDCYQCHQPDYAGAQNPPHTPSSYPTVCASCHSTTAWHPATFDHNLTGFPLTGEHRNVSCTNCHKNGQYAGTPTLCSSCHQQEFTASTNPPHAASGFPTTCESCHSTTAWVPSTFQHDTYFPISAGSRHSPGRWTLCADCHPAVGDFKVFACINCHTHAQATTDSKHSGIRNYQYTSQACYSCHPRGIN